MAEATTSERDALRLGRGTSAAGSAFKTLGRAVNPILRPIVGSGLVPIWGVVRHEGRKSRRIYATPVAVLATADGFLIPLPFGSSTDWCRNVLAAGGGAMRWQRAEYAISDPVVISTHDALPYLGAVLRVLVPAFGISRFLRVRRSSPTRPGTTARGAGTDSDR